MNEEFERARDAEAMDNFMYTFSPISDEAKKLFEENCRKFCKGANWAYEWCANETEHNQMKLVGIIKELKEALGHYKCARCSYDQDELCYGYISCQTLAKIESMENDNP